MGYPHDIQPTAKLAKDFTHPYPEMQDDSTYDKDYVKDENGDNGEWKAQTEYDHLRTALQRKRAEQEHSKEYRDELKKKLDQAKEAHAAAAAEAGGDDKALTDLEKKQKEEAEARKRKEEAEEALRKAEEAKNKKDGKDGSKGGSGDGSGDGKDGEGGGAGSDAVDAASKDVEKELKDIEQCKK